MKRPLFLIQAWIVCAALDALPPASGAGTQVSDTVTPASGPSGVNISTLFAGSWESGGNLSGRAQLVFDMPATGLNFRLQYTDRRKASSWDAFTESFAENSLAAVSGGLYHKPTDSRFLYGMITTSGLAARITNPRLKSAPFEELRVPSQSELKTAPSSTALPAFYLHLASPELEPASKIRLKAFGAASLESEGDPGTTLSFVPGKSALTAGTTVSFSRNSWARIESYYTEGTIPPRTPSTWFSYKPALPERDFRLYAGSAALHFTGFGLAADGAWSETFAYGKDFYGSLGLRFGDRPWRLSLAADGSGSRYVGPDGGENGAELRFAARLERRGKRSNLFRLEAIARAAETEDNSPGGFWELAEKPNRYSLGLYYRPQTGGVVHGLSFSVKGDDRVLGKESAGTEARVSLRLFGLGMDTRIGVSGLKGENPAFPDTARLGSYRFDSLKLHENLVWSRGPLQCKAGFGYTAEMKAAGLRTLWDASLAVTLKGKHGWLSFKANSPNLPGDWEYTVSWLIRN
jgi:hypothetical protein